MDDRIVITGMGTVHPLGKSVQETWQKIKSGESSIGPITLFDASSLPVRIGGEIKDFDPYVDLPYKLARRVDRVEQLNLVASIEAITQAGLDVDKIDPDRISVIVSSAIGGIGSIQENFKTLLSEGPRRISPNVIPNLMINGSSALIAIENGFKGPSYSVVSACSTGADNLGIAWMTLKSGVVDVVVAGAAEAPITEISIVGFDKLGALSSDNDDFSCTPRPFDKNRNGLVMSEAAAILILERESHAKKRGAIILGELAGYSATSDSYNITAPDIEGIGGGKAITNALQTARVSKFDVDYINAHGTATILNDLAETKAIKYAFGTQAYRIPVFSTKSMTGHTMGAAGALEAIFSILAINENLAPPTINYLTPDPDCDLDYIPNNSRGIKIKTAISNSFGFGGHNSVLVFREY